MRLRVFAIHACTAAVAVWHFVAALRPQLWDWADWLISRRDFFFIWGYKARLIQAAHGVPWSFLASLPNDFSHPDYPLLVPLLWAAAGVHPVAIAAIDTLLGAGLLVLVHRELRAELSPLTAALGTLTLSGAALLPWVGFADGPLVAFGAAAALLLRRRRSVGIALLLLAAAAMTKNEGMALAVSIAVALAVTGGRALLPRLWPVGAVIAAWLIVRASLGLSTDLFTGGVLARIGPNLAAFPRAFATVPTYLPFLWLGSLAALALAREHIRREAFLLTVVALQLAFYLAAYAITPLDVAGHVNGSWPRLTSHVTMLLGFAGMTSIGRLWEAR